MKDRLFRTIKNEKKKRSIRGRDAASVSFLRPQESEGGTRRKWAGRPKRKER